MKTTTIATIIVLIVLVAVAFIMLRRGDDEAGTVTPRESVSPQETVTGQFLQTAPSTSPDVSPSAMQATVSITDAGFSPATLTVKAGTTVTFVNNGTGPHWPASDPHPIHTDLSGFDAKRGLNPGETYSFTFTTVGTHGMHDHLHPSAKGSIIVQ